MFDDNMVYFTIKILKYLSLEDESMLDIYKWKHETCMTKNTLDKNTHGTFLECIGSGSIGASNSS